MFALHMCPFQALQQAGDAPRECVKWADVERQCLAGACDEPNYEWPCHLLMTPSSKYQEMLSQRDSERYPT